MRRDALLSAQVDYMDLPTPIKYEEIQREAMSARPKRKARRNPAAARVACARAARTAPLPSSPGGPGDAARDPRSRGPQPHLALPLPHGR